MLTSFGVSHLGRRAGRNLNIFYRMPPASLASTGHVFLPDYAVLLLAERIIIDKKTYDLLITGRHFSYGNVALVIKALHDEGFVRLEDFDSVIAKNRQILEAMLARDMLELDSWVKPLMESIKEWNRFVMGFRGNLRLTFFKEGLKDVKKTVEEHEFGEGISYFLEEMVFGHGGSYPHQINNLVIEALKSSRKRREKEHRHALRDILTGYLSYVNANILLSNEFNAGFYDWCDFRPFYRDKFLRIGRLSAPSHNETDAVKRLFEISFPELTFWTPENIVLALKDKRIVDLRRLIEAASTGQVEFDREFAVRILSEVLRIERSIGKFRNFVSYITSPLGFLPAVGTPAQKAIEEAIVQPIAYHRRKEYRWFYLISELSDRFMKKPSIHRSG